MPYVLPPTAILSNSPKDPKHTMDGSVFVMIATFLSQSRSDWHMSYGKRARADHHFLLPHNTHTFLLSLFLDQVVSIYSLCFSNFSSSGKKKKKTHAHMLRAGGHTAEMLNLVRVLKRGRFRPRYYIAAATDTMSLDKAKLLEGSELECVVWL